MVYSPFAEKGTGLEEFLQREQPALAGRQVHALLAGEPGEPGDDPALAAELERISGLGLSQLRVLYRSPLRRAGRQGTDVIDTVLADDPHKAVIPTRHEPNGPVVLELISGR
jgi:hypothetical protein